MRIPTESESCRRHPLPGRSRYTFFVLLCIRVPQLLVYSLLYCALLFSMSSRNAAAPLCSVEKVANVACTGISCQRERFYFSAISLRRAVVFPPFTRITFSVLLVRFFDKGHLFRDAFGELGNCLERFHCRTRTSDTSSKKEFKVQNPQKRETYVPQIPQN